VGHTGLVGAEGGEVGWRGRIIVTGEGADATRVVPGTLLGEETQVAAAGCFEFTVGHGDGVRYYGGGSTTTTTMTMTMAMVDEDGMIGFGQVTACTKNGSQCCVGIV